jgi:uracil-DNA glycosylase
MDLGNGLKTIAQLTVPAIGKGRYKYWLFVNCYFAIQSANFFISSLSGMFFTLSSCIESLATSKDPPQNKPNPCEKSNCSKYLLAESTKVILTLGKVAYDAYCKLVKFEGLTFKHDMTLLVSYHSNNRNTREANKADVD